MFVEIRIRFVDRGGRARHRGEGREVAVVDEVVLAEPHLVEAELVEPSDLLDRLGVHVAQRVVAAGRAAEVVRDAEPHRRGHATRLAHLPAPCLVAGWPVGEQAKPGPRRVVALDSPQSSLRCP